MSRMERVIAKAVRLVEPSAKEAQRVKSVADKVLVRVKEEASKMRPEPQVIFGGSFAKGTWVKGEADIDIFMKFPPELAKDELERIGAKLGRSSLEGYKPILRYAEHPYVEAVVEGIRVNVVACYDVKRGEWKSAADRSPYHTEFVISSFTNSLRREARLLKKLMKGIGVYGAEIKTQGFSGYVCEVLTLKYGSFLSTLEAVSGFRERQVVSLGEAPESLIKTFRSPIIILDPVDPRRNLGAAISAERVASLILASRDFLARPSLKYFTAFRADGPVSRLDGSPLAEGLLALNFSHRPRSVDVLWGQLKRSLRHLQRQLELGGFKPVRSCCASNDQKESAFVFLMEEVELPSNVVKPGPKVYRREDVERFLLKNRDRASLLWIGEDGGVLALTERKYREAGQLLQSLVKEGVKRSGVAPGLTSELAKTYRLYKGREVARAASRKMWLAKAALELVSSDEIFSRPR